MHCDNPLMSAGRWMTALVVQEEVEAEVEVKAEAEVEVKAEVEVEVDAAIGWRVTLRALAAWNICRAATKACCGMIHCEMHVVL